MTTKIPSSSDGAVIPKQELYVSFDEVVKTLPDFLQPGDEQERKELAMFLSQVDELHKPVVGKISATSVLKYLKHMLKLDTSDTDGLSQDTEQMQEFTGRIAFEISRNAICSDDDLHTTTISVLNVLREFSWVTKAALTLTTFALTFGDNGLNLCEVSEVSINEIQMFVELNGGYKTKSKSNDNLFTVVFQLVGIIAAFENLPIAYMTSMDHEVKYPRTHLIVIVYWIIKITVAAGTSHIKNLSTRGNDDFDKSILALWDLSSRWSKILKRLNEDEYLKNMLSKLQGLLEKDVDDGTYRKIKQIVEQGNHSHNMEVLNCLFPSQDAHPLKDCLGKRKVHKEELKGAHVLLLISGFEDIAPEVDETMLNEFIDSFDPKSNDQVECNIVWMPIVDHHSVQHEEATTKSMVKPFLDICYIVHQKLNPIVESRYKEKPKNLKGWYCVEEPLKISNEVKKFIKVDWKYKKGEPILVVLDPQGNVVNHNAIHMFYIWSVTAFPFTSQVEMGNWGQYLLDNDFFYTIYCALPQFKPQKLVDDAFYYGGGNMEWVKSLKEMIREIEGELGIKITMVYISKIHNQEENISNDYCLSDHLYLWLFWTRAKSIIYSCTQAKTFLRYESDEVLIRKLQMLLNYDQSNVGWTFRFLSYGENAPVVCHGEIVLSTLKEFNLWKEKASTEGFFAAFQSHYNKLYQSMFPFVQVQLPTAALKAPIDTMKCPHCESPMQQYTTFVCYHP